MARSIENSEGLSRESFLIPMHVFQSTKSCFYHIDGLSKRIFTLNHGFHTLFKVNMFFLLWWDLKIGVGILDLGWLGELSPTEFASFVWTQGRLRNSFLKKIFLL